MGDRVSVSGVRVRGPFAGYAVGFGDFLAGQGYTPRSVRLQVHLVAQLSRWLDAENLDVAGLTELAAERFIAARRLAPETLSPDRSERQARVKRQSRWDQRRGAHPHVATSTAARSFVADAIANGVPRLRGQGRPRA